MALTKIPFRPGFNKQLTDTQNENNWVDGDNVSVLDMANLKR
jgi:hypothetical protein